MRAVDTILFDYPTQDEDNRRVSLTALEDAPPDADVFPRVAFLGAQGAKETGALASQALASFASLLPMRRLAGWLSSTAPLCGIPVLSYSGTAFVPTMPPQQQVAYALAADDTLLPRLVAELPRLADPFPLALGLAHRAPCRDIVLAFVADRAASRPDLALVLAALFGKTVGRAIKRLGDKASPELAISLLRALPGHPERSWLKSFGPLVAPEDPRVAAHAATALGRIATPQAAALVAELASKFAEPMVQIQCVRSAMRIGGSDGSELPIAALKHADPRTQSVALDALLSAGLFDERLDRAADRLASSDDCNVRCLALAVLARAGLHARWKDLEKLANDDDPRTRLSASLALSRLADGRSQGLLEAMATKDTSRTVASTAVRGLTNARGGIAVKMFRDTLRRGGPIARAAAEVLVWRARSTPGEVFEVLGADVPAGPGLLALGIAVAATGAREGLGVLARAVQENDPHSSGWAVEALYPLGAAIPTSLLRQVLKSKVAALQVRAAVALTLAGDARGISSLMLISKHPKFGAQGARGLLDLAAILPAVRGLPLFSGAAELLPLEPSSIEGGAKADVSQSELEAAPWLIAEHSMSKRPGRFAKLASKLPDVDFAPHSGSNARLGQSFLNSTVAEMLGAEAQADKNLMDLEAATRREADMLPPGATEPTPARPSAPTPAPADRPPAAAGPPARHPVPSNPVKAPEAPPDPARPSRKGAVLALPGLTGISGRAAGAAIGLGALVGFAGIMWMLAQPSAPATEAPVASVAPLPDLGFAPFAAVGAKLERAGAPARGLTLSEGLQAGDRLETGSTGSLALQSGKGSRIALAESSKLHFRGPDPRGLYVFDELRGTARFEWKEAKGLRVELAGGVVETPKGVVRIDPAKLELKSGEARWIPNGGAESALSPGASIDLPAK